MEKKKKTTLRVLIVALLLSVITLGVVLYVERAILEDYEKVKVVMAKTDIEAGTYVKNDEISKYFEIKEVPKDLVLADVLTEMSELDEYIVNVKLQKGEQLTKNKLLNVGADILSKYDDPVEISVMVENLSDAVSGTLRKGDYVDLIAYADEDKTELKVVSEAIYVSGTYDTSGMEVTANSEEISSVVFNFIVERSDYVDIINSTAKGGIKLIKVSGIRE